MAHYVKSHGLGNDYIVIDPSRVPLALTPDAIRAICDRHRGVGSDGILMVVPGEGADFGMRIFNPDGSEAEKSGNGARIFAKFLRDHGYTSQDRFTVSTPGGVVACTVHHERGRVAAITVGMGKARIEGSPRTLEIDGRRVDVVPVNIGNPHCVVIVPDLASVDVHGLGPKIERHPAFPRRTNVQFAQVLSRARVRIEIWERGAGYTLASGSSSCAVAAACRSNGLVDKDVAVEMPGGELAISVASDNEVTMRGPVEEICSGDLSADLLRLLS